MRRLQDFPGFQIQTKSTSFNPFQQEIQQARTEAREKHGAPIQEQLQMPKQMQKTYNPFEGVVPTKVEKNTQAQNILDSPLTQEQASFVPLFPTVVKATEPLKEEEHELVPMIQPIDKQGKRLLYKYPKIPRVGSKGAYYLLVGTSDKSQTAHLLQFDGAANPNPGPSSSGAVLWSPPNLEGKRSVLFESGKYLGKATNNIAEAQGLLLSLQIAALRGVREILIEGDSELIVFHNIGKYKVSDKNLKVWWSQAQAAMMDESCFDWVAIRQVKREFNERADSITKEVLGRKEGFVRAY